MVQQGFINEINRIKAKLANQDDKNMDSPLRKMKNY